MSQYGKGISNSGPGAYIQTLTGNSGGAVGPLAGNIDVVGTGVITVVGNPGTHTLTITPSGSIASSFITTPATGTATPGRHPDFFGYRWHRGICCRIYSDGRWFRYQWRRNYNG